MVSESRVLRSKNFSYNKEQKGVIQSEEIFYLIPEDNKNIIQLSFWKEVLSENLSMDRFNTRYLQTHSLIANNNTVEILLSVR